MDNKKVSFYFKTTSLSCKNNKSEKHMKYLLPFFIIILIACQSNQSEPKTAEPSPTTPTDRLPDAPPQPTTTKLNPPDTAYVTAKSGLRVRNQPSLEGERIGVRPYGKKVLITERTGLAMTVQDEGKDVNGEWVGIESRLVTKGKVETVTGYIFSGFLSDQRVVSEEVVLANLSGNRSYMGIGGLVPNPDSDRARPREGIIAADDTVRIYAADLKTVTAIASHWFLRTGNRRYIQIDKSNCPRTRNRVAYSSELGVGNFPYVKSIKDGFAYLGDICGKPIWINLEELNSDYASFKSHIEIFEANPNGGGWEHGYTYIGPNKVLRANPDIASKAIVNKIPPGYEIYLLGPVKNNWAKVKLREAKQIFGEMYFEKSVYGKTWEGWVMIAEPDGAALIEPHIFGC